MLLTLKNNVPIVRSQGFSNILFLEGDHEPAMPHPKIWAAAFLLTAEAYKSVREEEGGK
jgi:hypothetical protein